MTIILLFIVYEQFQVWLIKNKLRVKTFPIVATRIHRKTLLHTELQRFITKYSYNNIIHKCVGYLTKYKVPTLILL